MTMYDNMSETQIYDFIAKCNQRLIKDWMTLWRVEISNFKGKIWACYSKKNLIAISKSWLECNNEEFAHNIFFHEYAHALTIWDWHWTKFKKMCLSLWTPYSLSSIKHKSLEIEFPKWKYEKYCINCGYVIYFHRKPTSKRKEACLDCCKKYNWWVFLDKFLIVPKNY